MVVRQNGSHDDRGASWWGCRYSHLESTRQLIRQYRNGHPDSLLLLLNVSRAMSTTRYHADCTECFWNTVGINHQPAFTRGRIHKVRAGHDVEFRITGNEDGPEIVSGWN
jgi:hypothetical protein